MTTRRPLGPRPPRPPEDSWWWDALYDPAAGDTNHTPPRPRRPPAVPRLRDAEKQADPGPDRPDTPAPAVPEQQTDLRDRLGLPRETPLRDALRDTNIKPRQQAKTRTAIYWGTAAAAGWWAGPGWSGLTPLLLDAMTAQGSENGVPAGVAMGVGFVLFGSVLAWRLPVWICRIPLAAAVLALALYGPDATL